MIHVLAYREGMEREYMKLVDVLNTHAHTHRGLFVSVPQRCGKSVMTDGVHTCTHAVSKLPQASVIIAAVMVIKAKRCLSTEEREKRETESRRLSS